MARLERGFSLRIHTITSDPNGPRTLEKSNWSGWGFICPRSSFPQYSSREDFLRPGVYLLLGEHDESELPGLYVGESEDLATRLKEHNSKEFWTTVIAFTSSSGQLNKAHIRYLESRLLELAKEASRCNIENKQFPPRPPLNEADRDDSETFLEEILVCLSTLGIGYFEATRPAKSISKQSLFLLKDKDGAVLAEGYETTAGFVIRKGAKLRIDETPSCPKGTVARRQKLVENGLVDQTSDYYLLKEDQTYGSVSSAAEMILARSSNGYEHWFTADGKSVREVRGEI